jgi:hypothetical protein
MYVIVFNSETMMSSFENLEQARQEFEIIKQEFENQTGEDGDIWFSLEERQILAG